MGAVVAWTIYYYLKGSAALFVLLCWITGVFMLVQKVSDKETLPTEN